MSPLYFYADRERRTYQTQIVLMLPSMHGDQIWTLAEASQCVAHARDARSAARQQKRRNGLALWWLTKPWRISEVTGRHTQLGVSQPAAEVPAAANSLRPKIPRTCELVYEDRRHCYPS
jgi:hypothetical protein